MSHIEYSIKKLVASLEAASQDGNLILDILIGVADTSDYYILYEALRNAPHITRSDAFQEALAKCIMNLTRPSDLIYTISDIPVLANNEIIRKAIKERIPTISENIKNEEWTINIISNIARYDNLIHEKKIKQAILSKRNLILETLKVHPEIFEEIYTIEYLVTDEDFKSIIIDGLVNLETTSYFYWYLNCLKGDLDLYNAVINELTSKSMSEKFLKFLNYVLTSEVLATNKEIETTILSRLQEIVNFIKTRGSLWIIDTKGSFIDLGQSTVYLTLIDEMATILANKIRTGKETEQFIHYIEKSKELSRNPTILEAFGEVIETCQNAGSILFTISKKMWIVKENRIRQALLNRIDTHPSESGQIIEIINNSDSN